MTEWDNVLDEIRLRIPAGMFRIIEQADVSLSDYGLAIHAGERAPFIQARLSAIIQQAVERVIGDIEVVCTATPPAEWITQNPEYALLNGDHQPTPTVSSGNVALDDDFRKMSDISSDEADFLTASLATLSASGLQEHLRPSYEVQNGWMVHKSWAVSDGQQNERYKFIAPFVAEIVEKQIVFDEGDRSVLYKISGVKAGKKFEFDVTSDEWADTKSFVGKCLAHLPGKPPAVEPRLRSHWATAIAYLSDEHTMKYIRGYKHTGWTPDGKSFLMPQHSVGNGQTLLRDGEKIKEDIGGFNLKSASHDEQRRAVNALFDLLNVYRPSVIDTLIAHAFLAPLLHFVGNGARYVYHIYADTGSLKTELAKFIMGLYGPPDEKAITYKWGLGTPVGVESRAHALKDCLLLLDDLKPGTIAPSDLPRWVAFIQSAVDGEGRKRASITGGAGASQRPRALLLSTGEAIPEAGEASYTARMLLAELDPQPTTGRNLELDRIKTYRQHLPGLMRAYIEWLIKIGPSEINRVYNEILATNFNIPSTHARLISNLSANRLGAVMFARFCRETKLLTVEQVASYLSNHLDGIREIVLRTARIAFEERYSQRYLAGLLGAISTGSGRLSDQNCTNRVGWEDDDYVYVLYGAKEIVDKYLVEAGQEPINITKKALAKQLYDDGLTYSTDSRVKAGYFDYQKKSGDPATGSRSPVLAFHKTSFWGKDE